VAVDTGLGNSFSSLSSLGRLRLYLSHKSSSKEGYFPRTTFLKGSESAQDQINMFAVIFRVGYLILWPTTFAVRCKHGGVKTCMSILSSSRSPTTSMASFAALHAKLMIRKLTKSTSKLTERWVRVGARREACEAEVAMNRAEYPKL
jgi:hypothetical protein